MNSYVVSAQLICAFVFADAKDIVSHDAAHIVFDGISHIKRKPAFAYAKTKAHISCAVTAQLISASVSATVIVQSLSFLKPEV